MSTFNVATIDTGHEDMIHDAQMDFLGTKLATCSCDKNIRIFDLNLSTGTHTFVSELKGHEGPVLAVGVGASTIRHYSGVMFLRPESDYLEGGRGTQGGWEERA